MQVRCKHCDKDVEPITKEVKPHIGAYCPECARWIKWLPKIQEREVNKELLDNVKKSLKNIWQQKS